MSRAGLFDHTPTPDGSPGVELMVPLASIIQPQRKKGIEHEYTINQTLLDAILQQARNNPSASFTLHLTTAVDGTDTVSHAGAKATALNSKFSDAFLFNQAHAAITQALQQHAHPNLTVQPKPTACMTATGTLDITALEHANIDSQQTCVFYRSDNSAAQKQAEHFFAAVPLTSSSQLDYSSKMLSDCQKADEVIVCVDVDSTVFLELPTIATSKTTLKTATTDAIKQAADFKASIHLTTTRTISKGETSTSDPRSIASVIAALKEQDITIPGDNVHFTARAQQEAELKVRPTDKRGKPYKLWHKGHFIFAEQKKIRWFPKPKGPAVIILIDDDPAEGAHFYARFEKSLAPSDKGKIKAHFVQSSTDDKLSRDSNIALANLSRQVTARIKAAKIRTDALKSDTSVVSCSA